MNKIYVMLIIVVVVLGLFFVYAKPFRQTTDFHTHIDFKVYLNDAVFNFSQEKYIPEGRELNPIVHLHDMDGDIIHIHTKGVNLGLFFSSLGMQFNSTCFILDNGSQYCSQDNTNLKMYVNGIRNYQYNNYEPNDLDRILVTYGNDSPDSIQQQINSVTNNSCIYSDKCPERGPPPPESCSTQTGCPI